MSLEKNDKITWVDVDKLKPHPKNTNKHPKDQIERLAKIINYQGFRSPIVVSNLSGFIVAGHGRLEAAKKLGLTKVPVSYQDFEDAKMELAHLNADNAIALWAEIDMKAMTESLKEINFDLDLDFLGFKDFKLESESKPGGTDDDAVPEVAENEFGVQIGDIWQLGNHRIMCGDSTDEAAVTRLMDGQKADVVHTDPPYNVDYNSDHSGNIKNDNMSDGDFESFLKKTFNNIYNFTKENSFIYIWHATLIHEFDKVVREYDWKLSNKIIWLKDIPTYSMARYKWKYEPCFFIVKGSPEFFGDKTRTNVWEVKSIQSAGSIDDNGDSWFKGGAKNLTLHPTQKPTELCAQVIKDTRPSLVLDLFLGSGSTLIACEKESASCYGMELDIKFMNVIIKRWQDFTGKQAKKL